MSETKPSGSLAGLLKEKQLVLLAVVSVIMAVVILGPVLGQLRERLAMKKRLDKQLSDLQEKYNALSGIEPIFIDERVKKMEQVFPSKKPIVQLIGTLAELSGQHNLSFGGISLQPGSLEEEEKAPVKKAKKTIANPDLRDLKFGFQIGGDFESILTFMKDLENVAPLMKVDKIGLTIKTNPLFERQTTLVVADIEVIAYYQAPPQKLGSISAPVKLLSREEVALLNKLTGFKTFKTVIPVAPTGKENLFE